MGPAPPADTDEGSPTLRVLVVTNMFPTPTLPSTGTFVAAQVQSLRASGLEIEVLHLPRGESGRHVYRGLARRARTLVASFRPDLVHAMYGGVMADTLTRTVRERPVVVSFCGTDVLAGPAGGGLLERVALRYGVAASHRAARRADGIIVKSRNLLEALPSDVSRSKAWIVPNGIDLERFRPLDRQECRRQLGWDAEQRHVLFPASPARPEKRFALAEAGVSMLEDDGLGATLHSLDGVRHDDVPIWLNAADVVLLTSAYEGSPNAVKEALACDVAIVSVDVGDVAERLRGIEGCHVADATPEGVAQKLRLALGRRGPIAGRASVANLALERVAERVREIYEVVTGEARTTGGHRT